MSTRKAFGRMASRVFDKVRKTYRHQTNQDQIAFVRKIIRDQFSKISKSLDKYVGMSMPALPKDFKHTDFNPDTVLTKKLKTIGQALYGTYLTQTHFRILYGSNYETKTTTGLTPMFINIRHYPFMFDMMTDLKLVACPIFGYLDLERVVPPIPRDDLFVVYLDNVHYVCDHENLLIYIPQYSYVCQSATGNFKLTHTRPEKWKIHKAFGEFEDSTVPDFTALHFTGTANPDLTGFAHPYDLTGTKPYDFTFAPKPTRGIYGKTSTGLGFPDALLKGGRLHAPLQIKITQGKGLFGLQSLSKYKRIAYKLYWIDAMLELCDYSFAHLYLVQAVYIRTLGYPSSDWSKFFNKTSSVTQSKFQGFITSEQKRFLTKAATAEGWFTRVWNSTVGRITAKDSDAFKTLMVFLSRKYPSKEHNLIHRVTSTENIIQAAYTPSSLVRIENKLSTIAAAFNNLTPEEKERTMSQFDYIDYSVTVDLSGKTKTYNAQQYLAIFVTNELKGDVSYIIQPFLELKDLVLTPTFTSEQIHKLIEGAGSEKGVTFFEALGKTFSAMYGHADSSS